jgi:hypothetical protein
MSICAQAFTDLLDAEIKGLYVSAFGPRGLGLWGRNEDKIIQYKIKKIEFAYEDKDDPEYVQINVYLDKYDYKKYGLIYTDDTFERSFNFLVKHSKLGRYVRGSISYTEQGMQGKDFVSMELNTKA